MTGSVGLAGPARFYRGTHDNVRRQILGALFSELVVYREDDIVGVSAHRTEINEALQQLRHHAGRDADPVMTETKRTSRISAGGSSSTSMRLTLSNDVNILTMVDIVYLCSNKSTASVTAAEIRHLSDSTRVSARESQPRVKRGWNRLSSDNQAAVVARYRNGETSTVLAEEFGVAKSTVLRILRDADVVVRRQPMTPDQVSQAATLYESGLSLSHVARQLQVNQETMRVAILRAGTVLREPTRAKPA